MTARTGQVRGQVPIGRRAFGVYLSPDGRILYIPEHDAFALSVVDVAVFAKRRTIPLNPLGPGAFDKPHYLAISPDGARLYLPFQGRALLVIDTRSWNTASHPLEIEAHQHGIAVSRDGTRLYVANNAFGGEGSLSEIETRTLRELRRVRLGRYHHEQVALDRTGRRAFLTGGFALGGHDEPTIVDLEGGAATRVSTGGSRPFAILTGALNLDSQGAMRLAVSLARASRAARRASRSGSGVRDSLVTAMTTATAVLGSVRQAACTTRGRAPRCVRSQ